MRILLDMRTIVFSNEVTYIICMLVILFLWLQSRKRFMGTGFWVFHFAFQTTAVFLLVLRGSIPDWMSIVLANSLVIGGFILGYTGLQRFVGKKISQIHNYVLLAVFACIHTYFALIQPNLTVRSVNFSVMLLIISFQCMWFLVYRVEPAIRRLTLGVGMVFGAYGLVSIARIVGVITGTRAINDLFQSGTFEALVLISYQVLFILLTYSLVLMVNKRLLVEVKTEEEKFAKAFHSSPYGITLTRLSDGRIVEVNDGFLNMAGYQPAEAIGKTTVDLHLWDKEEERTVFFNELSKRGKIQGREFQFRKKSGEVITGLFSAEIISINNQEFVLSSVSDITERKRAEEALRESKERYRSLFEHMLSGFAYCQMLFDERGHPSDFVYLSVNEAFGSLTGLKDVIGKRVTQVIPRIKELTPELFEVYGRVASTGNPERFEIDFKPLGLYLLVSVHSPAKNYFVAVFDDITERKRAEVRLMADLAALTRMHALSGRLLGTEGLQPLLKEIMDAAVAIAGAERGTLQLLEGDSLRIVAHHGHQQPFLEFFASAENRASVYGEVTRRGERVVVPDVETSSLFAGTPSLAVLREAGVRAVQSTPMLSRTGTLIGILTTQWSVPYFLDEHDLWRIDLLARQVADLIEYAKAEEALRKSHDELEMRVQERTKELQVMNEELRTENEERQRVEIDLRESEDRLRDLSAALLSVQERERNLIAREIHDSMGASLAAVKFKIEGVLTEWGNSNPQIRAALENVIPILQGTMEEARRIQMSLRPSMLDDLGILPTINWFCRQFQSTYPRISIKQEIDIQEHDVPEPLKIVIYRVLQEALNNVAKHSKAAVVLLCLRRAENEIQLVIRDSGQGFDLEEAYSRKGTTKGLGLDSMRERVELSGGSFSIESRKGAGTVIRATWLLDR